MQETQVLSLGEEDLLKKGIATHTRILAWRIPWTEKPAGYSPWDSLVKNTGVDCHSLLQEIFLTQGLNLGLPHCRQIPYCLSHQGIYIH